MDISPDVHLLRSLRAERIDHGVLTGEAVDNAFDANANCVTVTIGEDEILFEDDGCGIEQNHIRALFSLGAHGEMRSTKLGRFGIGITSHAVRVGDILDVQSISADGRVTAVCDWRDVVRTGRWSIPDARWLPVPVGKPTGTSISIYGLRPAPKLMIDRIIEDLAMRFYPAIVDARRIVVNGITVPLFADPVMTDIIEAELTLSAGRSARLRAGILVNQSKLNRVHVAYEHRVIMPASTIGTGDYSGLNKLFARLQLMGKNWHLARYKDDLSDEEERTELEEAVLEVLTPILEKCRSAKMEQRIDELAQLINEMVPPEMAPSRPKRQQERKPKPKQDKRTGIVSPEKSTPDGPAKTPRSPLDRLLITFDGINEKQGVGEFQGTGKLKRVDLSPDNPYVAELIRHRDTELAARSLYALAIALFEQGREQHRAQQDLPFVSFGQRVARLLAIQQSDGKVSTG